MPYRSIQPSGTGFRVWSATDMYEFEPLSATWAGGTATVTSKNHGLATGDSVTFACVDTTNGWNAGAKTVTVVDLNTFTVPMAGNPGVLPNSDPHTYLTRRVYVTCAKYSKTFSFCDQVQVETLGSTIQLQAKLVADAPWANITASLVVGINSITPYNFTRLTYSGGTSVSTVSVQGKLK